jgi:hypothetical protein
MTSPSCGFSLAVSGMMMPPPAEARPPCLRRLAADDLVLRKAVFKSLEWKKSALARVGC